MEELQIAVLKSIDYGIWEGIRKIKEIKDLFYRNLNINIIKKVKKMFRFLQRICRSLIIYNLLFRDEIIEENNVIISGLKEQINFLEKEFK